MKARGNGKDSVTPKMKMIFEIGDFVRVSQTTHDSRMPASRMGHIVEEYKTIIHYTDKKPEPTGIWKVFMTNGEVLRFHEMFLEKVDGPERTRKESD